MMSHTWCLILLLCNSDLSFQELAKLLEDQHGYIDLQNIPENKYYSMDKNPDEDEKLWGITRVQMERVETAGSDIGVSRTV